MSTTAQMNERANSNEVRRRERDEEALHIQDAAQSRCGAERTAPQTGQRISGI